MDEAAWLAERFEEHRSRLRAMAYRMLGSASEADDAVQETWVRVSRSDTSAVENLGAWLTTVVARVCLNMLRARKSRPEQPLDVDLPTLRRARAGTDPEQEALLADSVGLALLVVLDTLTPAERLAFVLHDMFAVPFDEIAPIVGRTTPADAPARQPRPPPGPGEAAGSDADVARKRELVDAFLAASRDGDFEALLAVLDPDVVLRADAVGGGQAAVDRDRAGRPPSPRSRAAHAARRRRWSTGLPASCGSRRQPRVVYEFTIAAGRSSRSTYPQTPSACASWT